MECPEERYREPQGRPAPLWGVRKDPESVEMGAARETGWHDGKAREPASASCQFGFAWGTVGGKVS